MQFLYYDAKGTDGSDLSRMDAVWRYNDQEVRIPANAANPQAAIFQKLGLDPAAEAARLTALTNARTADAAITLTQSEITAASSVADLKAILTKMATRLARLSAEVADLRTGQG